MFQRLVQGAPRLIYLELPTGLTPENLRRLFNPSYSERQGAKTIARTAASQVAARRRCRPRRREPPTAAPSQPSVCCGSRRTAAARETLARVARGVSRCQMDQPRDACQALRASELAPIVQKQARVTESAPGAGGAAVSMGGQYACRRLFARVLRKQSMLLIKIQLESPLMVPGPYLGTLMF
jgi:hypothetical protein